jgi:hypothetical protein
MMLYFCDFNTVMKWVVSPSLITHTWSKNFILSRACNLTSFSPCLTGQVDYLFASHHGTQVQIPWGDLCETWILLLAMSRYNAVIDNSMDSFSEHAMKQGDEALNASWLQFFICIERIMAEYVLHDTLCTEDRVTYKWKLTAFEEVAASPQLPLSPRGESGLSVTWTTVDNR